MIRPGPEFAALLREFHTSAWRFEAQPSYRVEMEQEALRRYLDTGEVDVDYLSTWLAGVREAARAGKSYSRVRVLHQPLTDYQRFAMAVAPHNVAAGEDIRTLSVERARESGLPQHDFWILDDERVAIMRFGPGGMKHAELVEESGEVVRHLEWRRRAEQSAVRLEEHDHPVDG